MHWHFNLKAVIASLNLFKLDCFSLYEATTALSETPDLCTIIYLFIFVNANTIIKEKQKTPYYQTNNTLSGNII